MVFRIILTSHKKIIERIKLIVASERHESKKPRIFDNIRNMKFSVLLKLLIPLEVAGHAKKTNPISITYDKNT